MDEGAVVIAAVLIVLRRLEVFSSAERTVILRAFTRLLARLDAADAGSGGPAGRASPAP